MRSPEAQSAAGRHSRARGNPGSFTGGLAWIPVFTGMTEPKPVQPAVESSKYLSKENAKSTKEEKLNVEIFFFESNHPFFVAFVRFSENGVDSSHS